MPARRLTFSAMTAPVPLAARECPFRHAARLLAMVAGLLLAAVVAQSTGWTGYSDHEVSVPHDWQSMPRVGAAHSMSARAALSISPLGRTDAHDGGLGDFHFAAEEDVCTAGGSSCGPNFRNFQDLRVGDHDLFLHPMVPIAERCVGNGGSTGADARSCELGKLRIRKSPRAELWVVTILEGYPGEERSLAAFSRSRGPGVGSTWRARVRALAGATGSALLALAWAILSGRCDDFFYRRRSDAKIEPLPASPYRAQSKREDDALAVAEAHDAHRSRLAIAAIGVATVASAVAFMLG